VASHPNTSDLSSYFINSVGADIGHSSRVFSVDPRPLASVPTNVTHYTREVHSIVDIDDIIQNETVDFIHDIRSDFVDEDQYRLAVNTEIDELNEILRVVYEDCELNDWKHARFRRIVIKININSLSRYILPANGRMLYQPFCRQRGTYEIRYVCMCKRSNPLRGFPDILMKTLRDDDSYFWNATEISLFSSMFVMRLDKENYMLEHGGPSMNDMNLYTLNNWNSTTDCKEYLDNKRVSDSVISYFTVKYIDKVTETTIYEWDVVTPGSWNVVDSRTWIKAKITGLYFFTKYDLSVYANELRTSEAFIASFIMTLYRALYNITIHKRNGANAKKVEVMTLSQLKMTIVYYGILRLKSWLKMLRRN